MFPEDDEEMMDMEQFSAGGQPPPAMPMQQPNPSNSMGLRQFHANNIGLGESGPTTVSMDELADLLGPNLGEGYSDYGAMPDEAPTPLNSYGEPSEAMGPQDPMELRADIDDSPVDPEDVKKDIRALLLQRAQQRQQLSAAYQDQSDELGDADY